MDFYPSEHSLAVFISNGEQDSDLATETPANEELY